MRLDWKACVYQTAPHLLHSIMLMLTVLTAGWVTEDANVCEMFAKVERTIVESLRFLSASTSLLCLGEGLQGAALSRSKTQIRVFSGYGPSKCSQSPWVCLHSPISILCRRGPMCLVVGCRRLTNPPFPNLPSVWGGDILWVKCTIRGNHCKPVVACSYQHCEEK